MRGGKEAPSLSLRIGTGLWRRKHHMEGKKKKVRKNQQEKGEWGSKGCPFTLIHMSVNHAPTKKSGRRAYTSERGG